MTAQLEAAALRSSQDRDHCAVVTVHGNERPCVHHEGAHIGRTAGEGIGGNKRTGVLAMLVFLTVNGQEDLPEPDALEEVTLAVAASRMGRAELTEWLRGQLSPA